MTDDYLEDEALTKCGENGFTPYTTAHDNEIINNAIASMAPQGRPGQQVFTDQAQRSGPPLTPFYTLGGPTTHFAGSGADPWAEAGWGNRRTKLRTSGVSEENWLFRTADECRNIDRMLKAYREERLTVLDGVDAMRGWVYAVESATEKGVKEGVESLRSVRAGIETDRSGLSQEVTFEGMAMDTATALQGDISMDELEMEKSSVADIVVQTREEEDKGNNMWRWGVGGEWKPGIIRTVYEVGSDHTIDQRYAEKSSLTRTCLTSHFTLSHAAPR